MLLNAFISLAQELNLNQGEAVQSNYYTSIPYENIQGKILIHVEIRGKQYKFLFDTGSPNIINKEILEELKLPVIIKQNLTDVTSHQDSALVVSLDLTLGGIEFKRIPTMVSSNFLQAGCLNISGIIGSNLLRNSIVRFSSKENIIFLSDDENNFSLNKKQSSNIILTTEESNPIIWIKYKNKNIAKEQLLFDTGCDGFYIPALSHFNIFNKQNVYSEVIKGYGNSLFGMYVVAAADTVHYRITVPQMNINGAIFKNVISQTNAIGNSLLGTKLFDYGIVTVDFRNKKFYFEPFVETINYKNEDWPFNPTFKNGKLVVGLLWDGDLKEKLNIGDQIISIDSMNLEKFDPCEFFTKTWPLLKLKPSISLVIINSKEEKVELKIEKGTHDKLNNNSH
jgi:hypothetical protein